MRLDAGAFQLDSKLPARLVGSISQRALDDAQRTGEHFVVEAELAVGGVTLVRDGAPLRFDPQAASAAMGAAEVEIVIDLHQGTARAVAWGCELTEAYVVENSAYTT